jgi:hypothetical protein
MRRTLSVLLLTTLVAGCSALQGSLPSHSGSFVDSTGMTVEQYAIGRLARPPHAACPKAVRTSQFHAAQRAKACAR